FPIVLTLGGGPANQTLEVAIYEAVRLYFDLGAAVHLALVQLLVCAAIIIPATTLAPTAAMFGQRNNFHWPETHWLSVVQAFLLILFFAGFTALLAAVRGEGFAPFGSILFQTAFWQATATSLAIGTASALVSVGLGIALGMA